MWVALFWKNKQVQHKPCKGSSCSWLVACIFGMRPVYDYESFVLRKDKSSRADVSRWKKKTIPQLQWIWSCTEMLHVVFNSKDAATVWTNVCIYVSLKQDLSRICQVIWVHVWENARGKEQLCVRAWAGVKPALWQRWRPRSQGTAGW